MRRNIRLLLLLAICCDRNAKAEAEPDIYEVMKNSLVLPDLRHHKDIVILVGRSGSGKSTLSKFLRKDAGLKVIKRGKKFIFVDEDDKIGSANFFQSKTLYPNFDEDLQTGALIVDCPGFKDTRTPVFDLMGGFLIKEIMNMAHRIKLLLVINHASVDETTGNRDDLIDVLQHISDIVGVNLGSFNGSIGLVATKAPYDEETDSVLDFLERARDFLNTEIQEKSRSKDGTLAKILARKLAILEIILDGGFVALFKKPRIVGNPYIYDECYSEIRNMVFENLTYASQFIAEFGFTIAPATELHVTGMLSKVINMHNDDLLHSLKNEILRSVNYIRKPTFLSIKPALSYCLNLLDSIKLVKSFSQLEVVLQKNYATDKILQSVRSHSAELQFLHKALRISYEGTIEQASVATFSQKQLIINHVIAMMELIKFFEYFFIDLDSYQVQFNAQDALNQIAEIESVSKFKADLQRFQSFGYQGETISSAYLISASEINATVFKNLMMLSKDMLLDDDSRLSMDGTVATYTGRYVILSKVIELLKKTSTVSELLLVATRKLFIDVDWTLQHTHLVLAAPVVEVVNGAKEIELYGKNTETQGTIKSCTENTGADGDAGFSSGNFRLYALDVENANKLTIQLTGGNGANGQNGGAGCSASIDVPEPLALSGRHEHLCNAPVNTGYHCYLGAVTKFQGDTKKNAKVLYELRNKRAPTNGGNGGAAGAGARHGNHKINLKNVSTTINVFSRIGKSGSPGRGGLPGELAPACSYRIYKCFAEESLYTCRENYEQSTGYCGWYSANPANEGQKGKGKKTAILNQLFPETSKMLSVIVQYLKTNVFAGRNAAMHKSEADDFLQFLLSQLTDPQTLADNCKEIIGLVNDFLSHVNEMTVERLQYVLRIAYVTHDYLINRQMHCSDCDQVAVCIIGTLSLNQARHIEAIFHRRLTLNVSSKVSALENKLESALLVPSDAHKTEDTLSPKLVSMINTQTLMHETLQKRLKESVKWYQNIFVKNLEQVQVLAVSQIESSKILIANKNDLSDAILNKIALDVITGFSSITTIFHHLTPSLLTRKLLPEITPDDLLVERNMTVEIESVRNKIMEFTAKILRNRKIGMEDIRERTRQIVNREDEFLSKKKRNIIKNFAANFTAVCCSNEHDIIAVFDLALNELTTLNDEQSFAPVELEILTDIFAVKICVQTRGLICKNQDTLSSVAIEQINLAVEKKNVELALLVEFEGNLHEELKPMLDKLLAIFESYNPQNSQHFQIQMQRFKFQQRSRWSIARMDKLSELFLTRNDELTSLVLDLQAFEADMIKVHDLALETLHRSQIDEFVGQIKNENCPEGTEPATCDLLKKAVATVRTSELIREYTQVFVAYQQVVFPFGGRNVKALDTSLLTVSLAPNAQDKGLETMRESLSSIQEDLSAEDNDTLILKAEFHSNNNATPFFEWSGPQFALQIQKLLSGKQTTFVASVGAAHVKNAVKFRSVGLSFTAAPTLSDRGALRELHAILENFNVEMIHSGENHFRCGDAYYTVGSDPESSLEFVSSFNKLDSDYDDSAGFKESPLSPYTVWKFRLVPKSERGGGDLLQKMGSYVDKVKLELIGYGYYVDEEACTDDLGKVYDMVTDYADLYSLH